MNTILHLWDSKERSVMVSSYNDLLHYSQHSLEYSDYFLKEFFLFFFASTIK